ncbi:MAG: glycosyltransferase family 2 protein [Candidatus Woesearchaeota archaeon]
MRILRILYVKNEADIIDENLRWYFDQNIPAVIVDNGSTDGTQDICAHYKGNGVLELTVLQTKGFDVIALLKKGYELANKHNPEWILIADADEFFETKTMENIADFIEHQQSRGFDVIQCDNMEFWMTDKDDPSIESVVKRITYYSYFPSNMFRVFKNYPGIDIWTNIGHSPIMPAGINACISPEHIISRHYKFRSLEQACRKVHAIRPEGDKHLQYAKYDDALSWYIIDSRLLTRREDNSEWNYSINYFGGRMNKEELRVYLGLESIRDVERWLKKRSLR